MAVESTNDIQEHPIWQFWEMGLSVIPCGTIGKMPAYYEQSYNSKAEAEAGWLKKPRVSWKEYNTRQPSAQEIEGWLSTLGWFNYGIVCGRDIVVVDADSQEAMAWVEENLTPTPWHVDTGKGRHYYYRANPDLPVTNKVNVDRKVDLRGYGGYVIGPGSTHQTGVVYTLKVAEGFAGASLDELPYLSRQDMALFEDRPADKVQLSEVGVNEGGRNNQIARLTGLWIAEGHGPDQILAKALAINAENNPPLSREEVAHTVSSIFKTHIGNAIEHSLPAAASPTKRLLIRPDEIQVSAPKWLIKGVLAERGLGMIFGPSGSGKSFASLDMCLSVAAGRDWHGRKVKQGAVVYVCGEGLEGVFNRIMAWQKHTGVSVADLPIRITERPVHFLDGGRVSELVNAIDNDSTDLGGNVSLVCVDTLNRNFGDGEENSTKDMTRFIDAMSDVQRRYACSVLMVHHTGHAEGDRARGSSALKASLDYELQVKVTSTPQEIQKTLAVVGRKMKDGRDFDETHFRLVDVPLGVDEDGDEFGSCVIEPCDAPIDMKAPGRPSKGLTAMQTILSGYVARARGNGHEGAIVVDRNELISDLKAALGPTAKNSNRYVAQAIEKGQIVDMGTAFEVIE